MIDKSCIYAAVVEGFYKNGYSAFDTNQIELNVNTNIKDLTLKIQCRKKKKLTSICKKKEESLQIELNFKTKTFETKLQFEKRSLESSSC